MLRHGGPTAYVVSLIVLLRRTHYEVRLDAEYCHSRKCGPGYFMCKKHKHLFDQIISEENFENAYHKTRNGKRRSYSYLEFKEYGALNLKQLREEVATGKYKIGEYRHFYINDPKLRLISALPFRDRIVQHAINNVIEPIFDNTFLPYTFACRKGKGTHAGVIYVQSQMRKITKGYVLKTDFKKYFPSIDRPTLYRIIDKKITCNQTSRLLREICPDIGIGLNIGSLSSQLWANVYGTLADRYIHHNLQPFAWARYMDDIVILHDNKEELSEIRHRLQKYAKDYMKMTFSRWSIQSISKGVNFLGYRIWPTHKLVRKESVARAKRKLRNMRKHNDIESLEKFIASWKGHIQWADSKNLQTKLEVI